MQLEEIEYARINEIDSDDEESAPALPDYNDEENAIGIVAEVTGLKARDQAKKSTFFLCYTKLSLKHSR